MKMTILISDTERLASRSTSMAILFLTLLSASCSSQTPMEEPIRSDPELLNEVTLSANVRKWDDQSIVVDYTLVNGSDVEIITLDNSNALQIERQPNGRIRLFKGMQDTGETDFEQPPSIDGRTIAASSNATGSGTRLMPLRLDYDVDSEVDPATSSVEFCIGHGTANELAAALMSDGLYSLNSHVNTQNLACTTLDRLDSGELTTLNSPLDDGQWEDTLTRAIEMLDGKDPLMAIQSANLLQLPTDTDAMDGPVVITDYIFFSTETGGGQVTIATCENGGGFEITDSSEDVGREHINVTDCEIGTWTINGQLKRTVSRDQNLPESTTLEFNNFIAANDVMQISMSSGKYEFQGGHPITTSALLEMSYILESGGETKRVTGMNVVDKSIYGTAFDRTLTASYTVNASWTNNTPLQVSTPIGLSGLTTSQTGSDFTQGSLELFTNDTERLTLDLVNTVDGEVQITLERSGSVTTAYISNPLTSL